MLTIATMMGPQKDLHHFPAMPLSREGISQRRAICLQARYRAALNWASLMTLCEESRTLGGNEVLGAPPNRCSPVNSTSLAPEAPAGRGTSCSCALKLQNTSATSSDGSPRLITIHRMPSLKSTLIKSLRQFDRQRFDLRNAMNAR